MPVSRPSETGRPSGFPQSNFSLPAKVAAGVGGFIVLGTIWGCGYTIDQTERGALIRNGAFQSIAQPGLNFKVPWIDSIYHINVETHKKSWEQMEAYSADQQQTFMKVTVIYHVAPDKIPELYSRFAGNAEQAVDRLIRPQVFAQTKTVFGTYTAVRAVTERGKLNSDATAAIQASLVSDPVITVENILLEDIKFSDKYIHSVEERMQAEVDVQKLEQHLRQKKVEAEMAVAVAMGQAEARVAQAKAEADAIRLKGDAEAAAIKAKSDALNASPSLVAYEGVQKWNGILPVSMIPGNAVPFVNLPLTAPTK